MRFGHFDDARREYVITIRRRRTPGSTTWAARASSPSSRTSPVGTASTATRGFRRLTRYRYNNVPADLGGPLLYVNDAGDHMGALVHARPRRSSTSTSAGGTASATR